MNSVVQMHTEMEREALERILSFFYRHGWDRDRFTASGKFSQDQWYRWTNSKRADAPNTRQCMEIYKMTDMSPTWAWYGIGPERISECSQEDDLVAKVNEIHAAVVKEK